MTQDEMLQDLRKVFTEETQFCASFASLHYKLFTQSFEQLFHELDGNNRQDTPDFTIFDFNYQEISGTIAKKENGQAQLSDEVWFYKPEHTEPSLIIYLDSEGFPTNFTYDPDGIQW